MANNKSSFDSELFELFDKENPKSTYNIASKYGISQEELKRKILEDYTQLGSPLNAKEWDAARIDKPVRTILTPTENRVLKAAGELDYYAPLRKIPDEIDNLLSGTAKVMSSKPAQILSRGVLAPAATGLEGYKTFQDIKKGEYTDALSSGLGAASGLATIAGSGYALPLAAGSLGVAGGKESGKKQAELAGQGISYDPTTGYTRSEEELSEDVKNQSPGTGNLFDVSPVLGKNKWKPQGQKEFKPVDYKKNAISEDELENLSNPEMVEKEKENKAYQDALAVSRVTKPNLTEGQHEVNALRAVRQLREKRALEAEGKTPVTALGDFLSGLFEESPESAKNRREIARKEFDRANEVRRSMGLPEKPMPKEYMEEVPYVKKEEDEKPYEFKSKQLGETPTRSSGLKESEKDFKDFLTKAQVKYPESASKGQDYVKDLSDEELQEISRKEARSKDLNLEKFDYEKNKAVIDAYNEVAQEEGMNPNLLLAHSRQESGLVPGIKNAEGTSTATGLGQLTVGAYQDVQRDNPEFKDVSFEQLNDPKNIKLQAKAHAKYLKQLIKNSGGDEEIALRKYFQGGYGNDYYQKLADKGIDSKGNRLTDEQKQKLRRRGWDGPDADEYVDRVQGYQNMLSDEPISVASRGPASEKIASNPKEEAMKRIRNFLRTGDKSVLSAEESPLTFGPSSNPFAYEQGMSSNKRLMDLKKQYDEVMSQKGKTPSGESINFVPVDGEDGKPANFVPVEGPDGQPMPSESTPSATPPQESAPTAPSTSAQKQVENIINQQTNLKEELLRAQNAAAENKFYANLARAATQIATGAAGLKGKVSAKMPDTGVFEDLQKQADIPVTEFEQRIKIEGEDPNSEVSNSMRSILEQDLKDIGVKANLSGLSYNQMKEIYSPISSRISRVEAAKLRKEEKDERERDKKESKIKDEQNKFLDNSRKTFTKEDSMNHYLTVKNAVDQIDDYIKNPTAVKAQSLGYLFATISDPKSVVRESEIKLFGSAGGVLDKIFQQAKLMQSGTYTEKKAKEFKDFVLQKLQGYQSNLESKVSGYIKGGQRYGISEQDVVENILGPDFWENIYKKKAIQNTADKFFKGDVDKANAFLKQRGDI